MPCIFSRDFTVFAWSKCHCLFLGEHMSLLDIFSARCSLALKPFWLGRVLLFWMEARQTESSHMLRGGLLFPALPPRRPCSRPITRLSTGKRAIQFLKAAVPILREVMGEKVQQKTAHLKNRNSKASQHCSFHVFLFSFLLNVNSHVSLSPSISEHPPKYKIGIILLSHPFQTQQITHLCTYIHKLKGQSMVVCTYLLKDESKTDSHLECEVTTA